MSDLSILLSKARKLGAGTLHIRPDHPPFVRVNGHFGRLEPGAIRETEISSMVSSILSEAQRKAYKRLGSLDVRVQIGNGFYKINLFRLEQGQGLVVRREDSRLPEMEESGIPEFLADFLDLRSGLILFSGPIGSGKTTTLTALLNQLGRIRQLQVVSIEEQMEYSLDELQGYGQQMEVGTHVGSFAQGVKIARQIGADVVIVGDLPDRETVEAVLDSAVSGTLLLASIHSGSVVHALAKLDSLLAGGSHTRNRYLLSEGIKAVISQVLVPRKDGLGVVPAFEVLTSSPTVRDLVNAGDFPALLEYMQSGSRIGTSTLDDYLLELVAEDIVHQEDAYSLAFDRSRFELPAFTSSARSGSWLFDDEAFPLEK